MSLVLRSVEISELDFLFHLPSLRKLCLRAQINDVPHRDIRHGLPPAHSSPIRELIIKKGFIEAGTWGMARMMDSCHSLEKFVYRGKWAHTDVYETLAPAIHRQRDSLTHIQVTPGRDRRNLLGEKGTIGSLADLSKLNYIRIPAAIVNEYSIQEQPELYLASLPTGLLFIDLMIFVDIVHRPALVNSKYPTLAVTAAAHFPNLQQFILSFRTSASTRAGRRSYILEDGRWVLLDRKSHMDTDITDHEESDPFPGTRGYWERGGRP
jgi:hypothetical protein